MDLMTLDSFSPISIYWAFQKTFASKFNKVIDVTVVTSLKFESPSFPSLPLLGRKEPFGVFHRPALFF